jgi:hypothetical protein
MPPPEVPHPIPAIASRFALNLGSDETFRSPEKPGPDSIGDKNNFELGPLTFSNPELAVDDEPLRSESLRRPLHLGDDFLRHRPGSLLIAGKVHRVLGAALG